MSKVKVDILPVEQIVGYDLDFEINQLNEHIEQMKSHADRTDLLVSTASGLLCGILDIVWTGDFSLERGRDIADNKVGKFVEKIAKMLGCKNEGLDGAVRFLEDKFPIPADGVTSEFGGGLQHHLRDFAHHPTIVGLIFSLLTQFTEKCYGTDTTGKFKIVPVPEKSRIFIGKDIPDKILKGTIVWFFHLISDIAGSSNTAGKSGGTGIPGPILSLAKEISSMPVFNKKGDNPISAFCSKLFNGTLLAEHDENGKIIKGSELKLDLRGELGVAVEIGRQALPVIANECIVRAFYFIRRLINEIKEMSVSSISDIVSIDWNKVKPYDSPTLTRMLTVATAVFTAVDITDAIASKKYFVAVNFVGLGRCAVSLESEMKNFLKIRDVKRIRTMYEDIRLNTYTYKDGEAYGRMEECMDLHKFGLTLEQTEILYNLERYKIIDDINKASKIVNNKKAKELKSKWFEEWQRYMEKGFADFTGVKDAKLEWYTTASLIDKVKQNNPKGTWFRLVLLEAMIFEPYYALSLVTDKDGKKVPSTEYDELKYDNSDGDQFLDNFFPDSLRVKGYVKRLRKCYDKMLNELSEVLKMRLTRLKITAVITLAIVTTAGMFAPAIAVALVGSNFAGLSGAALINACLAYIGGGAVAAGGFGMAGGTMVIVGGGAALGLGVGAGVGNAVSAMGFVDKRMTILQSAKLMTAVREIFLKDEHDTELSDSVFEQYIENTKKMEHQLIEMKYQVYDLKEKERKALEEKIKNAEEAINAMQIALKSMEKYSSRFMLEIENEGDCNS